jgi:hypothetical protein
VSVDAERSKTETRAAIENRAVIYRYIFEELEEELGRERATEVMRRAIYKRGLAHGQEKYLAAAQEGDFDAVGELFVRGSASEGELFKPAVDRVDRQGVDLSMRGCPLVDAWKAMGLAEEEVDLMCRIAAAVDEGTFDGAGLCVTFRERLGQPGGSACLLEIRRP